MFVCYNQSHNVTEDDEKGYYKAGKIMAIAEKHTLQRVGVSEQIFNILKSRIASGEWTPGMKISSENEIAAEFGVSRMSARNAVQRLCAMGLLETRTGEGTFVKEFRLKNYFEEAAELIANPKNMNDIREFRRFFETDYLILASERRTDEDIEDLKRLHQKMKEMADKEDYDSFFEVDMQFHHRICMMSRNEVFLMVETVLRELLMVQLKDNTRHYAEIKGSSMNKDDDNYVLKILAEEHQDFIDALEKRDYNLASRSLETYMTRYQSSEK